MRSTIRIISSNMKKFSLLPHAHLISPHIEQNPSAISIIETINIIKPSSSNLSVAFSSSNLETPIAPKIPNSHEGCSSESDHSDVSDDDDNIRQLNLKDEGLVQDVTIIMSILHQLSGNPVEMKNKIEHCGVKVSRELVLEVLSRIRNDWEAAFTFFLWAGRQLGYSHSVREYHAMISILGKMRKFDTAWALIDEMRGVKTGISLVTPQTLLIMIRKYCAVHDVGRAINTFYAHKRFKFDLGIDEFQSLLSALCRYKNVQDAEHLMFCNKDVFPFNTKSFNIVLNGWCNVIGSPREADRIWREMCKRRIHYDVVSYASIISCYSKAGNLYKVFKLYNQMKEVGIEPDRKIYNSVIFALAKGRHVSEAINLMKTMEEKGIAPNTVTYNSLIKPLCRARKIDEARGLFDEMLQHGHSPTIRTYHAFFRSLRTGEEVFALLENMRKLGCHPTIDTYIMLIRKFCRWRQFDDVFKLWNQISENGLGPDRSSYIVLIHGLFLNGKLEEAYKFYADMKEKQLLPDPKLDEMLQTWLSNKQVAECQMTESKVDQLDCSRLGNQRRATSKRINHEKDFLQQAEIRRVVRERGFSFWKQ
ncbi:pentatricopeptide repeat-containing protein At5g15010, mitochondrial [Ricinus communis]|uniref:pentatricopeptide repeat-containing protein At5g15010, mitochondrial n=1 Tax=Ricinus communis TaxID=3988 RepID=UPI00201AEA8F|nr:pentatricopeptide repeat-containing protein At5g15010, mitochondrial [Ricinus communis]